MKCVSLLAVAATVVACNLNSTNPLDTVPGAEVDPGPYLGTWEIVEMDGVAPAETTVTVVQQVANGVTFSLAGEEAGMARLTAIGSAVYASFDSEGRWNIMRVSLEDGGNAMLLAAMDSVLVEQDINGSLIPGRVVSIEVGTKQILLTASGAELRNYIAARPALFPTVGIRLVKVP